MSKYYTGTSKKWQDHTVIRKLRGQGMVLALPEDNYSHITTLFFEWAWQKVISWQRPTALKQALNFLCTLLLPYMWKSKKMKRREGEKELTCRFKVSSLAHVRLCSKFSCQGCLLHIPSETTRAHHLGPRRFVHTLPFLILWGINIQSCIIRKMLQRRKKNHLNIINPGGILSFFLPVLRGMPTALVITSN